MLGALQHTNSDTSTSKGPHKTVLLALRSYISVASSIVVKQVGQMVLELKFSSPVSGWALLATFFCALGEAFCTAEEPFRVAVQFNLLFALFFSIVRNTSSPVFVSLLVDFEFYTFNAL